MTGRVDFRVGMVMEMVAFLVVEVLIAMLDIAKMGYCTETFK
jgi:hypothetical protein